MCFQLGMKIHHSEKMPVKVQIQVQLIILKPESRQDMETIHPSVPRTSGVVEQVIGSTINKFLTNPRS